MAALRAAPAEGRPAGGARGAGDPSSAAVQRRLGSSWAHLARLLLAEAVLAEAVLLAGHERVGRGVQRPRGNAAAPGECSSPGECSGLGECSSPGECGGADSHAFESALASATAPGGD